MLDELKTVPAGAFDAVDASSLMVDPNSGQVRGGGSPAPAPAAPPRPKAAAPLRPSASTMPPPLMPTTTAPVAATTTSTTETDVVAAPPPRPAGTDPASSDNPWWPLALGVTAWTGAAAATARRANGRRSG
jgi:hypothetical protein